MNILDEVKGASSIGISGHIRPDGDCIGATMGMYLYLTKMLPDVTIDVLLQNYPKEFECIHRIEDIKTDFKGSVEKYDAFIVIDCSADRIGDAIPYFESAGKTINIDHHITNTGCANSNYIVPDASSASELVYDVLENKEDLDVEIAKALYIGIIHDTGVLQYSNVRPKTLCTVAELIRYDFDFPAIITNTFYEKTYVQNQIMGRAVLESIRFMDGQCIFSVIDKKTMDFYEALPSDLDGIVNQMLNTKGVECAIFMYQLNSMEYKVSMRSKGKVDVSKIASMFGGGGHVRAAGVTMQGTYHDVINNLSAQIKQQL